MTALHPLGDQAALAYFADEATALRFAAALRQANPPWLVDVVQAYTSVAVFFDPDRTRFADAAEFLRGVGVRSQGSGVRQKVRPRWARWAIRDRTA
jgi:allophanate hydrolase subunit 1